jgi:large subunit ribosomal protein L29
MKIQAMLDWSPEEKAAKVKEWTQSLFTLRLQKATGQLENPMKIKQLRKDIARLMTAQHMRAVETAAAAAHEAAPAQAEGAEEKISSKGQEAAATPKPKGHAAATPSGKGAKKRVAAAKATGKKTAGAAAKAHSPSTKSSSAGSAKKSVAPKAKSGSAKSSNKR